MLKYAAIHIYNHLHTGNPFYKHNSGFSPRQSTVCKLINIYHQICKGFDDKKSTCIVLCDKNSIYTILVNYSLVSYFITV